MNLNRAQIIGNLTRDPESRSTPSGQNVCSFTIATTYSYKDANGQKVEKPEYHNIVAWGKLADICSQFLAKGRKVYAEGRLQTREWTAQDGQKRSRTEIIAENVILLDRAGAGAGGMGGGSRMSSGGDMPAAAPSSNPDDEIKIEDIPF